MSTRYRMTWLWWHWMPKCSLKAALRNFLILIGVLSILQSIFSFSVLSNFYGTSRILSGEQWRRSLQKLTKLETIPPVLTRGDVISTSPEISQTSATFDQLNNKKLNEARFDTASPERPLPNMTTKAIISYSASVDRLERVRHCPKTPPDLVGRVPIITDEPKSWADLERAIVGVEPGGRWKPTGCLSRNRVAIIVPYRNREKHLKIFLRHIHPFLQSQLAEYGIFIIEQTAEGRFNRAMLLNIGFLEAAKIFPFQCYIFHDVDLLPEDDGNTYACHSRPTHMSVALDIHNYTLFYKRAFGGVTAMKPSTMWAVNGYSNMYFGWGAEDDDMYWRVRSHKLRVNRPSAAVARYTMLTHVHATENYQRHKLLHYARYRRNKEGLNSIQYLLKRIEYRPLYTLVQVQLNRTQTFNVPYTLYPKTSEKSG